MRRKILSIVLAIGLALETFSPTQALADQATVPAQTAESEIQSGENGGQGAENTESETADTSPEKNTDTHSDKNTASSSENVSKQTISDDSISGSSDNSSTGNGSSISTAESISEKTVSVPDQNQNKNDNVKKFSRDPDFSSGRLLIGTDDISDFEDKQYAISEYNGIWLFQYPDSATAEKEYYLHKSDPKVDFVTPDIEVKTADDDETSDTSDVMSENDNPYSELKSEIQDLSKEKSPTADIALIDTGSENGGVSMLGDDGIDRNGHGTDMLKYIQSVNPDASVLSIKAMKDDGTGDMSAVTAAIEYAIKAGVKVINLSMYAYSTKDNEAFVNVIKKAVNSGITVVGSAGNDASNVKYYVPGSIDEALIIGACDPDGKRIESSNYGATVDYFVPADSTSEAAAKASGYASLFDEKDIKRGFELNILKPSVKNALPIFPSDGFNADSKITPHDENILKAAADKYDREVDKNAIKRGPYTINIGNTVEIDGGNRFTDTSGKADDGGASSATSWTYFGIYKSNHNAAAPYMIKGNNGDHRWVPLSRIKNYTPCTVTFNANGGSGGGSRTYYYGVNGQSFSNVTATKAGYILSGWSDGKTTYATNCGVANWWIWDHRGGITLKAVWAECSTTVTFDANGGSGTRSAKYIYGGSNQHFSSSGFSKDGFTLAGWSVKSGSFNDYVYSANSGVTDGWINSHKGNFTVYAVWQPNTTTIPDGMYNILHYSTWFLDVGGNPPQYTSASVVQLWQYPAASDTWKIENTGESKYKFTIQNGTGTNNLCLDVSGGGDANNTKMQVWPSNDSDAQRFYFHQRSGYTAGNFNILTANSSKVQYRRAIDIPNDTRTNGNRLQTYQLYENDAQTWQLRYGVAYNANGGSGSMAVSDHFVNVAANLRKNTFTRTGYTFTGWNTKADGSGTHYSDEQSVMNIPNTSSINTTLYAQWKINSYTAYFNGNGGSNGSSITTTYGSQLGTLPGSSRTGYTFAGWWTAASGGTQISSTTTMPASNVTYYAHWNVNSYYLDLNGRINGSDSGGIGPAGTADVYINGTQVANDVSDFYQAYPYGSTYEIKDIKAASGYAYHGSVGAALSGTIGAGTVDVRLSYYAKPTVDRVINVQDGNDAYWAYASVDSHGSTLSRVQFPTWTDNNGQDDIQSNWTSNTEASGTAGSWTVNGQTYNYRYHVLASAHKGEHGQYETHVYAYNNQGDYGVATGSFIFRYTITRQYRLQNADGSWSGYQRIDSNSYNYGSTVPTWSRAADDTYQAASISARTVGVGNQTLSVDVYRNTASVAVQYRLQNADGSWGGYQAGWSGTLRTGQSYTWSYGQTASHYGVSKTVTYGNGTVSVDIVRRTGRLVIKANGGSGDRTTTAIRYGSTGDNISPMPSRTGYTLTGLYTAASGGTKVVNANGTKTNDGTYSKGGAWQLNSDVTVYAQWSINYYYFDLNGSLDGNVSGGTSPMGTADVYINGALVSSSATDFYQQYPYGTSYQIKNIKANAGYTYTGNTSYSGTIGAGNTGVTLPYTTNSYTLTYYENGGSNRTEPHNSVKYGSSLTVENYWSSTRPGYTPDGWAESAGGGTKYTPGQKFTMPARDYGLYQHWRANSVTVTFNGNGGSIAKNGTQTFTSGKGQSFADVGATRTGYTLAGWSDTAGGAVQYPVNNSVSDGWIGSGGSRTVYAVWSINHYRLNLNMLLPDGSEPYTTGAAGTFQLSLDGGNTWTGDIYNETGACGSVAYGADVRIRSIKPAAGLHFASVTGASNIGNGVYRLIMPAVAATINVSTAYNSITVNYYAPQIATTDAQNNNAAIGAGVKLTSATYNYNSTALNQYGLGNYNGGSWNLRATGYYPLSIWHIGSAESSRTVSADTTFAKAQDLASALGVSIDSSSQSVNIYAEMKPYTATFRLHANGAQKNGDTSLINDLFFTGTYNYDADFGTLWNYDGTGSFSLTRTGYAANKYWYANADQTGASVNQDSKIGNDKTQDYVKAFGKSMDSGNVTIDIYAGWTPNNYTVTYEDWFVDASNNRKVKIGSTTKSKPMDSTVNGNELGTNANLSAYYAYYQYKGSTSAKVTTSGATVYRYFWAWTDLNIYHAGGGSQNGATVALSHDGTNFTDVTNESDTVQPYGTTYYIKNIRPIHAYEEFDHVQNLVLKDGVYTYTPTASGTSMNIWMRYKTYAISYNLNGGNVSGNPESYRYDSGAITLKNPERKGYVFTGWTGSNGTTAQTSVTIPGNSSGNKSFTANWAPTVHYIVYHNNIHNDGVYKRPDGTTETDVSEERRKGDKSGSHTHGMTGTALTDNAGYQKVDEITDAKVLNNGFTWSSAN